MLINIISDLHTEFYSHKKCFDLITNVLYDMKGTTLVLAGDIGRIDTATSYHNLFLTLFLCSERFDHVVWVTGNHEYYTVNDTLTIYKIDRKLKTLSMNFNNVHLLQCSSVIIDGVTFIGCTLWSSINDEAVKRMADFRYIRVVQSETSTCLNKSEYLKLHFKHLAWLTYSVQRNKNYEPLIIVTHHGTHVKCSGKFLDEPTPLNSAFVTHLPQLWFGYYNHVMINGHTHECVYFQDGGAKFISNCYGYWDEEHCQRETLGKVILDTVDFYRRLT